MYLKPEEATIALNLISQQVLVLVSLDQPLCLTAYASPVGTGCVLVNATKDVKEPIVFASKSFSDRELRYLVHERQAAALIFRIKKFNKYFVPENLNCY